MSAIATLAFAIQTNADIGDPSVAGGDTDIIGHILRAGPLEMAVLVILLLFSAISWGIVVFKHLQFSKADKDTRAFLDVFRRSSRFSEVHAACSGLSASPLVGLFQSGYAELNAQLRSAGDGRPGAQASRPTLKSLEAVDRALIRASTAEAAKLEHRVSFLATTASITPYIGLFGTVWGIMSAFIGIGATGSSNLATVAPGIAVALVATAAGLFAAIPAVYFYNGFTSRVKATVTDMEDFSMEFLTIAERNFT